MLSDRSPMQTQETQSPAEFLTSVDLLSALTRADIERLAEGAQSRLLAFGDTDRKSVV